MQPGDVLGFDLGDGAAAATSTFHLAFPADTTPGVAQYLLYATCPGLLGPGLVGPGLLGPGLVGPGLLGPGLLGPGLLGPGLVPYGVPRVVGVLPFTPLGVQPNPAGSAALAADVTLGCFVGPADLLIAAADFAGDTIDYIFALQVIVGAADVTIAGSYSRCRC